jgi:hypothetical protein
VEVVAVSIVESAKPHVNVRAKQAKGCVNCLPENGESSSVINDEKLSDINLLLFLLV